MKLRVTKADAAIAKGYFDPGGCLLATALKRHFKTEEVYAGGWTMTIGRFLGAKLFQISRDDAKRLRDNYTRDGNRIRADFKPFEVELEPQ